VDLLFELDWCEVAQRTVEPLVVVEDFDERGDSPADLGDRGPGLAVYQFLLESGEPALANGVDAPMVCQEFEGTGRAVAGAMPSRRTR
jgi:hypothetical protein